MSKDKNREIKATITPYKNDMFSGMEENLYEESAVTLDFKSRMFTIYEDESSDNTAYESLMNKILDPESNFTLNELEGARAVTKTITSKGVVIIHVEYVEFTPVKETADNTDY